MNTKQLLGLVVAVVGVILGCWFGYWALYGNSLEQQRDAVHSSQQYQDGLIAAERSRIQGYDTSTNEAQKKQIQMTFCAAYTEIVHPPADLVAANTRIC